MKKRGVRDQMVIATKYTTPYRATFGDKEIIANTGGNGTKSLHTSLQWSLDNLQTSYIDLVFPTSSSRFKSLGLVTDRCSSCISTGGIIVALFLSSCNHLTRWSTLEKYSTSVPLTRPPGLLPKQTNMHVTTACANSLSTKASGQPRAATSNAISSL